MNATIRIRGPLITGRLLKRRRFILSVRTHDKVVKVFLPNTGRLSTIIKPGCRLLLRPVPERKETPFDAFVGYDEQVPVVIDSRIPNLLVREALNKRKLPEFKRYTGITSEVKIGASRIDFRLQNGKTCFLEVKGVTLAENKVALYPDAPTERGQRHLKLLGTLVQSGNDAGLMFLAMRPDVTMFEANSEMDPVFAKLLRKCEESEVKVVCYASEYKQGSVSLIHKLVYNPKTE
jgi:sugar fermentation stimulation protein A